MTDRTARVGSRLPEALVAGGLLLLALVPRLLFLSADPPQDMHEHFLTDEAWWAHNARNHALFGRWILDDHNPPLYGAPLFTWTLRGVYALTGTGLVPTRLLAAVSGALTCAALYVGLRRRQPRREALLPALFLTLGYFMLSYNRVGLVESFQLCLATVCLLCLRLAVERPAWGLPSGAALVLALMAKPTAIAIVPAVPIFWALHGWRARQDPAVPPWSWRHPAAFLLGAGVVGGTVLVAWFWPHRAAVLAQMAVSRSVTFTDFGSSRVELFGLPLLGIRRSGFVRQGAVLLLLLPLLLLARAGRRHGPPPGLTELLGWAWLASGLLVLLPQVYQVDRRFLILAPAVAILAGAALAPGGIALPGRAPGRAGWVLSAVGGLLLGGLLGLLALPWLSSGLRSVVTWAGAPALTVTRADTLAWHAAAFAGTAAGLWVARRGPVGPPRLRALAVILVFLVAEPGRFALVLARPTFTIASTSDSLAAFTRDWPADRRVIVGLTADAFAANTTLFPFVIRVRAHSALNVDGWRRFHPSMLVVLERPDRGRTDVATASMREAEARGFRRWRRFPIWPDPEGRPRYEALFLVDSVACGACPPLRGPSHQR